MESAAGEISVKRRWGGNRESIYFDVSPIREHSREFFKDVNVKTSCTLNHKYTIHIIFAQLQVIRIYDNLETAVNS